MRARFHKGTLLTLFGLFRQAETSLHRALSCSAWQQFLLFYDARKRDRIGRMVDSLRRCGAIQGLAPDRREFEGSELVSFLSAFVKLAVNPFKQSWSFSVREIAFFCTTLQRLLEFLQRAQPPGREEFLELRADCYYSCYIIGQKLLGVREMKDVDDIEHFYQSEHRKHFAFEELGLDAEESDRVPAQIAR